MQSRRAGPCPQPAQLSLSQSCLGILGSRQGRSHNRIPSLSSRSSCRGCAWRLSITSRGGTVRHLLLECCIAVSICTSRVQRHVIRTLPTHRTLTLTGFRLNPVVDAMLLPQFSCYCPHRKSACFSLTIWKQCVHSPTMIGQSSPGYLHFAHVPSKLTRQIPQVSSEFSGRSHFQAATALKDVIVTFMLAGGACIGGGKR
jgi:hypothetical protein